MTKTPEMNLVEIPSCNLINEYLYLNSSYHAAGIFSAALFSSRGVIMSILQFKRKNCGAHVCCALMPGQDMR